ncbi:Hypothetical predicted protein [Octopus vulgaris]|uniref:Uncharacterized protein n=1 Tax=Octopus vulgaris TaxID=6645 RepID=A0AA36FM15_OCTVU|nr:Hypothetical predicted protein [Octopus vulgaris]CAI9742808.1 Hypothetical predicted protein [Octopus vulgaris]
MDLSGCRTGDEEISLALIVEMLRGQMAQTDAFLERMDKRRQGLWADQQELEVADGSALEDRCWTGDSDGPVGGDCPSNEASSEGSVAEPGLVAEICDAVPEGSVAEPGLVAEICDAVPKKSCDLEPVEVEESERPVEGVMADAVVPCLGPLASRPLSLGARDEELARSGADVAESEVPAVCNGRGRCCAVCESFGVWAPVSRGPEGLYGSHCGEATGVDGLAAERACCEAFGEEDQAR